MSDVTAIVSLWKRNYLAEQLDSLLSQSHPPQRIVLVQNEAAMLDVAPIVATFADRPCEITCVRSDVNYKYFFRFAIGTLEQSEYLFFVDDDVIPGRRWLQTCIEKSRQYGAIVSPTGRIIPKDTFRPEKMFIYRRPECYMAGDATSDEENSSAEDRYVDYGCNSYFIRSEWIRHFWSVWPRTLQSGEDIHLSASLMIGRSIPTIVPQQTTPATCGNLRRTYGADQHASWRQKDFIAIREQIFRYLILEQGWKPILW